MPYVFAGGELLGGCDATKALIASGEFDKRVGRAATAAKGADAQNGTSEGAGDAAAVHDALRGFTARALRVYDDMEDHIRPVMRRYVPGPVQVRARLWVGACSSAGVLVGPARDRGAPVPAAVRSESASIIGGAIE